MAEHAESTEPKAAEITEKTETLASNSQSSSDDSDAEKLPSPPSPQKVEAFKMLGRERPVHHVLGGGKPADAFLWRNKKVSVGVLGGATAIWAFFEVLEYHLLPFLCYALILTLAVLFLWSNAHAFIHKSPPDVPEVIMEEEPFLQAASAVRIEINRAFALLRDVASGRDVKKFVAVVGGLWMLSVVGSWCNFLTLFYMVVVLLHTVPVVYEKYEGKIDAFAEKMVIESKKRYAVFDEKVVSKIRKGPLRGKKD